MSTPHITQTVQPILTDTHPITQTLQPTISKTKIPTIKFSAAAIPQKGA